MKKKISLICIMLCAVITLAFGLSACSSTAAPIISENWFRNYTLDVTDAYEKCVYDVEFKAGSGTNTKFSVESLSGTYTTELTCNFDSASASYYYNYTTEQTFNGKYSGTDAFTGDKITTSCRFYTTDNNLRPISSSREVLSHTPKYENGAYIVELYNYKVETVYSTGENAGNEATVTYKNLKTGSAETVTEMDDLLNKKYLCIDNEQYLFALRALTPTASGSNVIRVLSSIDKQQEELLVNCTDISAKTYSFNFMGTALSEREIRTCVLTSKLNSKFSGGTTTVWLANKITPVNTYYNIMLYMETPLSNALGSISYTLTDYTKTAV